MSFCADDVIIYVYMTSYFMFIVLLAVRYLGDQVDVEPASFLHQLTVAELLLGWL